ncbi:ABC transporter ATP-binding protein [Streptomyces sp. G5(2025)]|uniref:ABC transporter ATP-binding protein n=1 Tax=Streptomyces sp. G5(2025) TaxID=3406628 RepID=UPI003C1BB4C2
MSGGAGGLLRESLRRRRGEFLRLTGWSLVQAVPASLSGWMVARAVDDGFLAGRTGQGLAWLVALAGAVMVGAWATRRVTLGLSAVVEPLRDELVTLVTSGALNRSAQAGRPADTGGVARLTEHVEIAREAYGAVVMFVQGFVVTAAGVLLGLAALDPVLLVFVLPPLLLGLALFVGALRAMAGRQRDVVLADERIAESAGAVTGGLRDVAACGAEDLAQRRAGERIDAAAKATRALARVTAVRTASLGIGGWLPLVLILAGAPWLVQRGVSAGAILGAVTYVSRGLQPALQGLVQVLGGSGLWLLVTLSRIAEAAEGSTPDTTGAPDGERARPGTASPGGSGGVELRGVTFGYARSAEPVIDRLDLVLRPGEHLAVVGPSGAGKSTLAALVAGVLEPRAGRIRLDGVPLQDLGTGTLARYRVLIPQEAYVFVGTLWENLAYLAPDATPAEVDAAVDAVGARPLVERLGGYDMPADPRELSAGERQLVALVRSYLPPARLILLDEATCHLDPASEARAEEAFARRPGTLFVCAHRISSALRADRVLVLDGTGTALGTHDELMAGSALYRDLVGHWEVTESSQATRSLPGSNVTASRSPGRS